MPFDTYKVHDSATVKAWVLAGYKVINPDTIIGYYSYSSGAVVNTVLVNLLAETKYKIKIYFESPLDNGNGTTEYDFDTSALVGNSDMYFTMTYATSIKYGDRMRILCVLCKEYSLAYEYVYTDDGLNCDGDTNNGYMSKYI